MGKRGPKPKRLQIPEWTPELAYACGLMATDGCLYSDGRHLSLTSKDTQLLETFKKCLGLNVKISSKPSGDGSRCSQVQFGDVTLYEWFISIGITPRKTHTIGKVQIPDQYFFDYLRGEFDGDGSSHAYWDTRWHSSVSLYISFACASKKHLVWLDQTANRLAGISGHVRCGSKVYILKYAKQNSLKIYQAMYYSNSIAYLQRKKAKLDRQWAANYLAQKGQQPKGYKKGGSILRIA